MATSQISTFHGFSTSQVVHGSHRSGYAPSATSFTALKRYTAMDMGKMKTRDNWVHGM